MPTKAPDLGIIESERSGSSNFNAINSYVFVSLFRLFHLDSTGNGRVTFRKFGHLNYDFFLMYFDISLYVALTHNLKKVKLPRNAKRLFNCEQHFKSIYSEMASNDVNMGDSTPAGSSTSETSTAIPKPTSFDINKQPVCLIVLGMAGSGKTQFVKKLSQLSHLQNYNPYVINLDPACKEVPYHANIGEFVILLRLSSINKWYDAPFWRCRYSRHGQLQRGYETIPTGSERRHCHGSKFIFNEIRRCGRLGPTRRRQT